MVIHLSTGGSIVCPLSVRPSAKRDDPAAELNASSYAVVTHTVFMVILLLCACCGVASDNRLTVFASPRFDCVFANNMRASN